MIVWLFWLFLALGIAGLAILILMMIFGGMDIGVEGLDLDIGDLDVEIGDLEGGTGVGMPIILSFVSAFGWIGAILTYMEVNVILSSIIAVASAGGISVILFFMTQYFLKHFSSDSTVKHRSLIGKEGSVSVSIRPPEEGQIVVFTEQRGRTIIPAVSDKRIPVNTEVVIYGMIGDAVKVISKKEWKQRKMSSGKKKGLNQV